MPSPDLITGADVVYQQEHFDALITTLQDLAAAHTLIYLAFKIRGKLQPWLQVDMQSMYIDTKCSYDYHVLRVSQLQ